MAFSLKKKTVLSLTFLGVVVADWFFKSLVRTGSLGGGINFCNHGVAFGIPLPESLIWFLGIVFIGYLSFFLIRDLLYPDSNNPSFSPSFFLVLMLSGALSNLADRAINGCVTDFIRLSLWPAFNLADLAVISGALGLLVKCRKI